MAPPSFLQRFVIPLCLGGFIACSLWGVWVSGAGLLPHYSYFTRERVMRPVPAFVDIAIRHQDAVRNSVLPLSLAAGVLVLLICANRGGRRLLAYARRALVLLACLCALFSIYVLAAGGIGMFMAALGEQMKTSAYAQSLERFALLEATNQRIDRLSPN